MNQSKTMSMVESVVNVLVGFAINLVAQVLVFPLFGFYITLSENLMVGAIFTVISLVRSFTLRRVFEMFRGAIAS